MTTISKKAITSTNTAPAKRQEEAFDRKVYGALIRQKRIAIGYRTAEEFIDAMSDAGFVLSKSALYRIERGEQDPSLAFAMAASLVLTGKTLLSETTTPCICEAWRNPESNPMTARLLQRCPSPRTTTERTRLRDRLRSEDYESALKEASWFDYQVFINDFTTESELYITIAPADYDPSIDFDELDPPFTSHAIRTSADIERAVMQHLKRDGTHLSNDQIVKLIMHTAKIVEPYAEKYGINDL